MEGTLDQDSNCNARTNQFRVKKIESMVVCPTDQRITEELTVNKDDAKDAKPKDSHTKSTADRLIGASQFEPNLPILVEDEENNGEDGINLVNDSSDDGDPFHGFEEVTNYPDNLLVNTVEDEDKEGLIRENQKENNYGRIKR